MNEQTKRLLALTGAEIPIVQAPMATVATPALAAAACNAGALGSLGCAVLPPEAFRAQVEELRSLTNKPFNVNFFAHAAPTSDRERDGAFAARLKPYFDELEVEQPPGLAELFPSFDATMLEAVRELRPPIVSFHFGLPDAETVAAIKDDGAVLISTATTVAEARTLERRGVDVIVAQGHEAGGHSGVFEPDGGPGRAAAQIGAQIGAQVGAQIGTMALVPQIVDAVSVPVLAAGGLFDGRGVAAALALGAAGAQLGTAFVACPESAVNPVYREALTSCGDDGTRMTTLFSGRPARAISTRLLRELADLDGRTPAFPLPISQTMLLGMASAQRDSPDFAAMWAGQGAAGARAMPAGELVATLVAEAREAGAAI